ncbi:MAG: hypothetical protein WCA46_00750 [Actinocatenispora sp.]
MSDPQQPEYPRQPFPPADGYTVPGASAAGPPGGWSDDPLAGAPGDGFEGWLRRTVAICRRSFGPALALIGGTYVVPIVVLSVVTAIISARLSRVDTRPDPADPMGPLRDMVQSIAGWYALLLLLAVAAGYLQAVGWSAAVRVMARDAAGEPRDLGAALRFGLRRGLPLWGWLILEYLCVIVGLCACVLPGVYLSLAMSMIVPIVVFERGQPAITRSFRLVHNNFWPTVGRLLLLGLCVFAYTMVLSVVMNAITGTSSLSSPAEPQSFGAVLTGQLVVSLLSLPAAVVGVAGIVAAYAELRGREGTGVDTAQLAAATT